MTGHGRGRFVLAFAACLVLAACAAAPAAPAPPAATPARSVAAATAAPTATPAPVPDKVSLRLDFRPTGSQAPFFYALEKGFYKEARLEVTIGDGQTSASTTQVIGTKGDTFGWADASVVAPNVSKGVPVIMVANVLQQTPTLVVSRSDAPVAAPKDLEGKTVGLVFGGSAEQLFSALLAVNKIDATKVKTQNMDAASQAAAYFSKRVDALVTSAGTFISLKARAAQEGVSTREMWFADHGANVLAHGIIVNTDTLRAQPDLVRRFVAASIRGWTEAGKDPQGAAQALVKNRPEADLAVIRSQMDKFLTQTRTEKTKTQPIGFQAADDWEAMLAFLAKYGGMGERKPLAAYFTNDYLPAR